MDSLAAMGIGNFARRTCLTWIAVGLAPFIMGCSPSIYQAAYGGGVAMATREETPPAIAESLEDRSIAIAINRAWLNTSGTRFADLDAKVNDGTVILTGSAANPDDLIEAIEIIWRQDGVTAVESNAIFGATEQDRLLADTIRTRLSSDPDIHVDGFTIEVFDQSVYVIGQARSTDELDRVLRHIRSSGSIPRVVSLVTISQTGV